MEVTHDWYLFCRFHKLAIKVNIISTFSAREGLVISLNLVCVMMSQALHDIIITKH